MKLFSLTLLISVVCCLLGSCDGVVCNVTDCEHFSYELFVVTGDVLDAETTGFVYITLYGLKGNSPEIRLHNDWVKPYKGSDWLLEFLRGETNIYHINVTKDIGKVGKIRIKLRKADRVKGKRSREWSEITWYLQEIFLIDRRLRYARCYPFYNWLRIKNIYTQPPVTTFLYPSNGSTTAYKVTVETMDEKDAGTLGKVYITLIGEKGNSPKMLLDNDGEIEFQQGKTNHFNIFTKDIGNISNIRVELGATKQSPNPKWFLKAITLEDITRKFKQSFLYKKWLTTPANKRVVSVQIPPSN